MTNWAKNALCAEVTRLGASIQIVTSDTSRMVGDTEIEIFRIENARLRSLRRLQHEAATERALHYSIQLLGVVGFFTSPVRHRHRRFEPF